MENSEYFVIIGTDWEFVDVNFLLACRDMLTILSQSSGELCGPWASFFSVSVLVHINHNLKTNLFFVKFKKSICPNHIIVRI